MPEFEGSAEAMARAVATSTRSRLTFGWSIMVVEQPPGQDGELTFHSGGGRCEDAWEGKPPRVRSLRHLAALLRAEFEGKDVVCPVRLQALMAAYAPDSSHDWKPFAKFSRLRYTRNLVDSGDGRYNLMLLCWAEALGSAVHDHADAHCVMRVLEGSLTEVRFAWPKKMRGDGEGSEGTEVSEAQAGEEGEEEEEEEPLQEIGRTELREGDVCYINDSQGLHRVENPSHWRRAVSLHLYCPPFSACGVFNQQTGKRTCAPVTFHTRASLDPLAPPPPPAPASHMGGVAWTLAQ